VREKRRRRRRRRERKRARCVLAIPRKSDNRSHDRVQPIIFIPHTDNRVVRQCFRKDFFGRLASGEGSKSAANVGMSRGITSPLSQKYVEAVLRKTQDKQKSDVDYVYGVYLYKNGLMFGNKRFDMDDADNIIINCTICRYT